MPATNAPATSPKQTPIHTVRLGRIKAAIWENPHGDRTFYNVTITRTYRDDSTEEYGDSTSFGRDDLPLVAKVADEAHSWIYERLANARRGSADETQE